MNQTNSTCIRVNVFSVSPLQSNALNVFITLRQLLLCINKYYGKQFIAEHYITLWWILGLWIFS